MSPNQLDKDWLTHVKEVSGLDARLEWNEAYGMWSLVLNVKEKGWPTDDQVVALTDHGVVTMQWLEGVLERREEKYCQAICDEMDFFTERAALEYFSWRCASAMSTELEIKKS